MNTQSDSVTPTAPTGSAEEAAITRQIWGILSDMEEAIASVRAVLTVVEAVADGAANLGLEGHQCEALSRIALGGMGVVNDLHHIWNQALMVAKGDGRVAQ